MMIGDAMTPFDPTGGPVLLSMLPFSKLNLMLPLSILKSCRSYRFDDIIFEVDLPVFDISYFPPFREEDIHWK